MNAARKIEPRPVPAPTPLEVFKERASARAMLRREGEIGLHDAVDKLQKAAVESCLISEFGQDCIQTVLAREFGAAR